jgi:hypothetical protein
MSDERDLDAPLMAYLGAAGYRDIHLTHGPSEIGKDIIARMGDSAGAVQYALQTKRGNIGTGEWRDSVREQMWEAVRMGINHPGFDASLTRQGVLVLTGQLVGKGQEQIDLFNDELKREARRPIEVWNQEALVTLFDSVDSSTIYPADTGGFLGYGQFFSVYGVALNGRITPRQIERHSRRWLLESYDGKRLLIPAIEAAAIANACERAGNFYAAFHAHLALVRVGLDAVFASDDGTNEFFKAVAGEAITQAIMAAERFADHVWSLRELAPEKKLAHVTLGNGAFITYPLLCTQLGETLALVFMASTHEAVRASAIARLIKLVKVEPGISKVFSDSQTVSVVAICRALATAGESGLARSYLKTIAFEALNLYANRLGMASLEDDEQGEVERLVGIEFPEIRVPQRHESFMVTAILDLCAFLDDERLYEDVANDVQVHRMYPQYYRPLDTRGQFRYDGEDVTFSVNVEFESVLKPDYAYGQHLSDEPRTFRLLGVFGAGAFLCVSLLLRDRYFPTTWTTAAPQSKTATIDPLI